MCDHSAAFGSFCDHKRERWMWVKRAYQGIQGIRVYALVGSKTATGAHQHWSATLSAADVSNSWILLAISNF